MSTVPIKISSTCIFSFRWGNTKKKKCCTAKKFRLKLHEMTSVINPQEQRWSLKPGTGSLSALVLVCLQPFFFFAFSLSGWGEKYRRRRIGLSAWLSEQMNRRACIVNEGREFWSMEMRLETKSTQCTFRMQTVLSAAYINSSVSLLLATLIYVCVCVSVCARVHGSNT